MANKFLVWLIRTLMVVILVALIFSFASLEFEGLMKGMFGDVFAYGSKDAQQQTIKQLADSCAGLGQNKQIVSIGQICLNQSLYNEIRQNCNMYRQFKGEDILVENEKYHEEICELMDSGEIERACDQVKQPSIFPDLTKFGEACGKYSTGALNEREFFIEVLASPFGNQQFLMPDFLKNYMTVNNFLNRHRILYYVSLGILIILLYALLKDFYRFIMVIGSMCLSIGIIVLLPFVIVFFYNQVPGIDTTSILSTFFGRGNALDPKAIASLVMLLFLRAYNNTILIIGSTLLVIGIVIKAYLAHIKRRYGGLEGKKEDKKKQKFENLLKDLEEKNPKKEENN